MSVTIASVDEQIAAGRALVPDHLWTGVREHILFGRRSGNFLSAAFANDLLNAATGADEVSFERLPDLMRFLHNYAPYHCWGSRAVRDLWRELGGVERAAFEDPRFESLKEAAAA
ncbi:hypothetical protein [Sphingomonas sp. PAMC 26605]|uniref:hypothetical protein n=1 Tax=Sphingomonas sp. PAMC 26605 TaxID=1112214 RepID=UPI00026CAC35|nr:hypothetical protein [Sphingomonas sp. PAMC 26605]